MKKITPFNVKLLQLTAVNIQSLSQIKVHDTMEGMTKNFHKEGLFSTEIFGQMGSKTRMEHFAYIDIKVPILHPLVVRVLGKLKRIYPEILLSRTYAKWDASAKDFVKSDQLDGETGFAFFMKHYEDIVFSDKLSDSRELNIKFLNRMRKSGINTKIMVSPAGYRDYIIQSDGREEEDEVNEIYRRLLGLAANISPEVFKTEPEVYNRARASLQLAFIELYEYYEKIVEGKNKMIQGKMLSRQIHDGTRNVITSQNITTRELFDPAAPTVNSTGVGLFQFIKASRPLMLYQLKNGFLNELFSSPQAPVRLVNRSSLHAERILLKTSAYDTWMTVEGLERLMNLFGEESIRHMPIEIDEHYLALIYNDGKHFRVLHDIDDVPEGWDKSKVKPITYTEFFYIHAAKISHRVMMNNTRFPITGIGSIVPTEPYLKPTLKSEWLKALDENWQELPEDEQIYRNFPIRGAAFLNTMMPAPNKLQGHGGDFDGDKMTGMGVYSNEGVAECKQVLASRNFYVLPDGNIAHSMNTDTVKFLMVGMTGSVPTAPAKESIDEKNLDYSLMDQVNTRPDLVDALAKYIDATDYNLAPQLLELAGLMRKLSDVPKHITVYRGFDHAAGQNVMGAHEDVRMGEILSYRASDALVSTSTSQDVAESYGRFVIQIELDADKDNFLVITPELYQLCALKRPGTAEKYKELEVLIIPPNAFQGQILRVAKESLGVTFPGQTGLQIGNERVNLDVKTLFRDGSGRRPIVQINDVPYDLTDVMYSIEQGNIPSQSVNIKEELNWILENPKFEVPFDQRCQGVNRDAPAIGVRFEEYDNDLVVIDGWPEVMRAIEAGKPNIDMYIIGADQLKSLGEKAGL